MKQRSLSSYKNVCALDNFIFAVFIEHVHPLFYLVPMYMLTAPAGYFRYEYPLDSTKFKKLICFFAHPPKHH